MASAAQTQAMLAQGVGRLPVLKLDGRARPKVKAVKTRIKDLRDKRYTAKGITSALDMLRRAPERMHQLADVQCMPQRCPCCDQFIIIYDVCCGSLDIDAQLGLLTNCPLRSAGPLMGGPDGLMLGRKSPSPTLPRARSYSTLYRAHLE